MGQVNSGSGRTTGGPVVGGNKPLVEYSKYALGDEDEKLEIEKLKKRKIFWDTQPSYSVCLFESSQSSFTRLLTSTVHRDELRYGSCFGWFARQRIWVLRRLYAIVKT